jgi:hypothetical protein
MTALTRLVARSTLSSSARVNRISSRDSEGLARKRVSTFSRQALHQHPAEHGLAAADLAADLDDAFVVGDGVEQGLERGAAIGAFEKEIRVRGDAERRLAQAEMIQIHGAVVSPCYPVFVAAPKSRSSTSMRL